jgi:glycosyltransferase involved in cell wall biosynthesis
MKVVAIYPAFAPEINEQAMVWQRLTQSGEVQCRVIAGGSDKLKGLQSAEGIEHLPNMDIRRVAGLLAPGQVDDEAVEWAASFQPDLIFCTLQMNLRHAERIARRCGAPILLHCEFWDDPIILKRRQYLGIPALQPLVGKLLQFWYRSRVAAVAFSNPRETAHPDAAVPSHYLPWPHPPVAGGVDVPLAQRERNTVVHVGSLSAWKGAKRLQQYVDHLLSTEAGVNMVIVGPPGDEAAREAIAALQPWAAKGRLQHIERLPRQEAIGLIGRSLAVLAPHHRMGWGLIGDAWNTGTPVIAVDTHYDVRADANALVAPTPQAFVAAVQRLRTDDALWQRLSDEGRRVVTSQHGVDVVAQKLLSILRGTVKASPAREAVRA